MSTNQTIDADFFENIIIYNILTNEEYAAAVIDQAKPQFFKNADIRNVLRIVAKYFDKHNALPSGTEIKAYLTTDDLKQSFRTVLESISTLDKKYNVKELLENTETFLKEKSVYHTLMSVIDECQDGNVDTAKILHKFEEACSISLNQTLGHDYFVDIDDHIKDLNTIDKYIPSGWDWLDRKLGGGFLESGRAIYIFAGRTNVSVFSNSSFVATNMAAIGKTVLLVTLEMSEMIYAKRISSSLTQIPISDIQNKTDELSGKIREYRAVHPKSKLIIKEFPPSTITVGQLNGFIKKIVQKGVHIDAIVLDYVNLMHETTGNNSYEKVKHITEQLRALTYTYNVPIITATQVNRAGITDLNPGLETISESIGLAATADCIMSIWQEEEDAQLGIIRLGMMKNRFGPNFGAVGMRIDYSTLTLSEDEDINDTEEFSEINRALSELAE